MCPARGTEAGHGGKLKPLWVMTERLRLVEKWGLFSITIVQDNSHLARLPLSIGDCEPITNTSPLNPFRVQSSNVA